MRKYYIDNIRWVTVLLVVVYHVIYIFNSVLSFGIIGPVTTFHGQDAVQYLLYPWFMVILFIISGMCSYYYLENHSSKEYIKARTNKLLVPSTIGLFVFQWIQGYVNMSISNAFQSMPDTMPKLYYILLCAFQEQACYGQSSLCGFSHVFSFLCAKSKREDYGKLQEKRLSL